MPSSWPITCGLALSREPLRLALPLLAVYPYQYVSHRLPGARRRHQSSLLTVSGKPCWCLLLLLGSLAGLEQPSLCGSVLYSKRECRLLATPLLTRLLDLLTHISLVYPSSGLRFPPTFGICSSARVCASGSGWASALHPLSVWSRSGSPNDARLRIPLPPADPALAVLPTRWLPMP